MGGPAIGPGVVAPPDITPLAEDDTTGFGLASLVAALGTAELAVYGVLRETLPLLDLGADAALLAWGVGLVLMGPLLGLGALYVVLQRRLKGPSDKMPALDVATAPPQGPASVTNRMAPRTVTVPVRATAFPADTAVRPLRHPG